MHFWQTDAAIRIATKREGSDLSSKGGCSTLKHPALRATSVELDFSRDPPREIPRIASAIPLNRSASYPPGRNGIVAVAIRQCWMSQMGHGR
jgi:hypothetical protein